VTDFPFLGGESGALTPSDSNSFETASGSFNSLFARCAMRAGNNSSSWQTSTVMPTSGTDLWLAFEMEVQGNSHSVENSIVVWDDGAGNDRVRIRFHRTTYSFTLQYWNGSAYVDAGTPITLDAVAERQRIDIHIICNTASGTLDLYVAGTRRIASGTINLSGIASMHKARFHGMTFGPVGIPIDYSQVQIDDVSTIGKPVMTVVMTGNGNSTTWTGDFTNIDEIVSSDVDVINGVANTDKELYTGTPVGSFTGYRITGLAITSRSKKSGSGPAQMRHLLRSAGSNNNGTTLAQDFGYLAYYHSWTTNPATAVAFLSSEIAALEYGEEALT